jgi:hypothetical protein
MAMRKPAEPVPEPKPEDSYDLTIEDSFPASDPPPGVIKVGPRRPRPHPVESAPRAPRS